MSVNKIFDTVQGTNPRKSAFDLSHERKLSCNMGDLIPIYLQEVLPGDQFKVSSEIMLRMAPMIAPIMHRVDVFTHYFFVPNRIIWDQWDEFITGGEDGTAVPVIPQIAFSLSSGGLIQAGSLADYLGLPTVVDAATITNGLTVSQLPFRAYQEIYNEYYRDENLSTKVDIILADEINQLRGRAWEKDYFTSSLPFAQKGPAVSVPIDLNYLDSSIVKETIGGALAADGTLQTSGGETTGSAPVVDVRIENIEDGSLNIEELRRATVLQRWLEKAARGGSRVKEMILAQFGVHTSDSRLSRPEYLGGGKQKVMISEVLNTTGVAGQNPQGDMAGHGISTGSLNKFRRKFTEHGYVMGIMSVLPRTAYQQGVERHWNRADKFDFAWPDFAHLGEQEVLNKEVFFDFLVDTDNDVTFGYQQRFAEYKYSCDQVSGDFKTTLDFWHMGRIFPSLPALNGAFVKSDPTTRIFAVDNPDAHHLWVQVYNQVHARRPLPYFADPKLS